MVRRRKHPVATVATVPVGASNPSSVRELLLTLRTRLEAQLHGNGAGDATSSPGRAGMGGLADRADPAADVHDTVIERVVQGNLTRQLEQVKETLRRLDDGKYGICTHCLKPIAADRLVVRPFATLCIDCQSQLDRSKFARF